MVHGTPDGLSKKSGGKAREIDKRMAVEWKKSTIWDESPEQRNGDWRIGVGGLESTIEGTKGVNGTIDMELNG